MHFAVDKCPVALLSEHEVKPERASISDLLRETNVVITPYRRAVTYQHDYQRFFVFYP